MERLEFRDWLERNNERFITFTLDEIADIAIASGYNREEVCVWLVSLRQDRRMA